MSRDTQSNICESHSTASESCGETRQWYAVHVRSRHEFHVHRQLGEARIEAFLPTVDRLRRWKDRKKMVTFALFPGYLFVYLPESRQAHLPVLKTYGVVRFLSMIPGKPEPVPEQQILHLKTLVENAAELEPYPYLKEGQRVRIKHGPLSGVEGVLVEKKSRHILVLSIDIIRQGTAVAVDALDVEPV